jgi:hypothetical protein
MGAVGVLKISHHYGWQQAVSGLTRSISQV